MSLIWRGGGEGGDRYDGQRSREEVIQGRRAGDKEWRKRDRVRVDCCEMSSALRGCCARLLRLRETDSLIVFAAFHDVDFARSSARSARECLLYDILRVLAKRKAFVWRVESCEKADFKLSASFPSPHSSQLARHIRTMLHILDIPPELLIAIYYRVLDSTSLANRHLAQLRFSKTCRMFKEVADTRTCLYIDTTSRLARLGAAIGQWNASRCHSVDSVVLRDRRRCLKIVGSNVDALTKLARLQLLAVDIGDLPESEDIESFQHLVCRLGTLTTLNLNRNSNSRIDVTAESVIE